jgi:hypothetical protein
MWMFTFNQSYALVRIKFDYKNIEILFSRQSIFLPILPESMTWTTQCTAPYIIGIHSSIYSKMNKNELGDVIIVNIDNRTIESQYDDLSLFPKNLIRQMKKDIQQSSRLTGDHLARVFLRTMAVIIGSEKKFE